MLWFLTFFPLREAPEAMPSNYDVLVVGAGPAGSTAASEQRRQTVDRINLIFRSRLVCGLAARAFLYGEPLTVGTLARSLLR